MNSPLFYNTIRMAIAANLYTYGARLLDDIRGDRVYVVIVATDAGEASKKKITDKCLFYDIPYFIVLNKEEVWKLFNKDLSSFGITDQNLAKKLIENLYKGGFYCESQI